MNKMNERCRIENGRWLWCTEEVHFGSIGDPPDVTLCLTLGGEGMSVKIHYCPVCGTRLDGAPQRHGEEP